MSSEVMEQLRSEFAGIVHELKEHGPSGPQADTAALLMICDRLERLGSMLEDKLTSIEQRL